MQSARRACRISRRVLCPPQSPDPPWERRALSCDDKMPRLSATAGVRSAPRSGVMMWLCGARARAVRGGAGHRQTRWNERAPRRPTLNNRRDLVSPCPAGEVVVYHGRTDLLRDRIRHDEQLRPTRGVCQRVVLPPHLRASRAARSVVRCADMTGVSRRHIRMIERSPHRAVRLER